MAQDTTITLAEAGTAEEETNDRITDQAFLPIAPLNAAPAAYSAGTTYAKGALVTEGTQVYRSQQAANKAHEPKADADYEWWAPIGVAIVPLVNPDYNHASSAVGGF